MASNTTLLDGGFPIGTGSDVTIDSAAYTLVTVAHDLPVSQADAYLATGSPKGGAFVLGKQKHSVKIQAVTGVQRPSQLVPFQWTPPGVSVQSWWAITNLKINSANTGASIREYDADIVQLINSTFTTT